ncbi:hypothetical protein HYV10_00310 [Candidatus Dependentiae bacterium]|nr:hypothetical protein [Candidatus Dependentiae bacterium]
MKEYKYSIISALILILLNSNIQTELITLTNFEAIQKKSLFRIILLPSLFAITAYINTNKLMETLYSYPVTSCLLLYTIGQCVMDNYHQYKKINAMLDILRSSEKINRYLLCALLLKNSKQQFKNNPQVIDKIISEKIHEHSGFHIIEIEEFITNMHKKALAYLNKFDAIHFDFQLNDLTSFLLKEDFTLQEIIYLFKTDPEIYKELLLLQQNENLDISAILQKLGFKIKYEIQILLEKNLKDQI